MNFKKTAITTAMAVGTVAGSFTLASALTPTDTTPPAAAAEHTAPGDSDDVAEPDLGGSIQSPEAEGVSEVDEATSLEGIATITADEATAAALAANPGATLVDVSLGNENGTVIYEVGLTDATGATIEVKVDAGNAAVLGQEAGDDDAEEAGDASDEADDGIDHEFDGEETGENGDGVPDADDALEATEATAGN
jgi:uncharacterized membrane protein YkoI